MNKEHPKMAYRPSIRRFSLLGVTAVLLMAAGPPDGDFVTIDIPGAPQVYGLGIENHGLVTGLYVDAALNSHGFFSLDGVLTTVDGPTSNPPNSQAALYQINNQGWTGGQYNDDNGVVRAAIYNIGTGTWKTLPLIPGSGYNAAGGVNANGVVAGNWTTDPTIATGNRGWTFQNGAYSFFDVPGVDKVHYIGTIVNGINNAGVIAGYYSDANGVYHGFTKDGDDYRTIDVPGADFTGLNAINEEGDVVGTYHVGAAHHGFVLTRSGKLIIIDVPGAVRSSVGGISDNGNIVGFYTTADGDVHGYYVLKAVP
jgi:hypothetical protein